MKKIVILVILLILISSVFASILSLNTDNNVYLSFDSTDRNSANTTAYDLSNNSNHATINGGNFVTGKIGQAWNTTTGGVNNITITSDIIFDDSQSFSTSFWMYITDYPGADTQTFITLEPGGAVNTFRFYFQQNNHAVNDKLTFAIDDRNVNSVSVVSPSNLNLNEWYFIVGRFNATNNNMSLVINATTSINETVTFDTDIDGSTVVIGQTNPGTSMGVLIDEFALWNKTLTNQEITKLYNSQGGLDFRKPFYLEDITNRTSNIHKISRASIVLNNTILNASYVNFTLISANNSITLNNINGTKTTTSSLTNWTSQERVIDYNGTWSMRYEMLTTEGVFFNRTINFTHIDTTNPTVTIIEPSGTYEGDTPFTIPISLSSYDNSNTQACWYNVFLEIPSNTSIGTMTGNITSNFSATGSLQTLSYGTKQINVYCNDTAGNIGSASGFFSTSLATTSIPGGSGGVTTQTIPKIECGQEGADVFWTAETSTGGGSELFYVTANSQNKKSIYLTNSGRTNITINLKCTGSNGVCNNVILNETSIYLPNDKETKRIDYIFNVGDEKESVFFLGNGKDFSYNINLEDNQGTTGCSENILYQAKVDLGLGTAFKLDDSFFNVGFSILIGIIAFIITRALFKTSSNSLGKSKGFATGILPGILALVSIWVFLLFR